MVHVWNVFVPSPLSSLAAIREGERASAPKTLFVIRPFVSERNAFFLSPLFVCGFSARFVDCVPRTMMMTLVYEITIDLSTHNYMH